MKAPETRPPVDPALVRSAVEFAAEATRTVKALLDSRRWRIGDRFVSLLNELRGRPESVTVVQRRRMELLESELRDLALRAGVSPPEGMAVVGPLATLASDATVFEDPKEFLERTRPELSTTLVSIVVPTHNRAGDIERAVESVRRQSHAHWELIVVDDRSEDETAAIMERYLKIDPRIRFVKSTGIGVAAARNAGLRIARGAYIGYLDSDDWLHEDYVRIMLALTEGRSLRAAYCAAKLYGSDTGWGTEKARYLFREHDYRELAKSNYIPLPTYFHHRSLFEERGGFEESLRRWVDWDLLLRHLDGEEIATLPCALCYVDNRPDRSRITTRVSAGYFFRAKELHLERKRSPLTRVVKATHELSVLIPWRGFAAEHDEAAVRSARAGAQRLIETAAARGFRLEVFFLGDFPDASGAVRNLSVAGNSSRPLLINEAARVAGGKRLLIAAPWIALDESLCDWAIESARAGLETPALRAANSTRIANGFYDVASFSAPGPLGRDYDLRPGWFSKDFDVHGVSEELWTADREEFLRHGGLDTTFNGPLAVLDLGVRFRKSGLPVRWRGTFTARATAAAETAAGRAEDASQFAWKWPGISENDLFASRLRVTEFLAATPGGLALLPLMRSEPGALRVVIRVPAPRLEDAGMWGDFHFALSLQRALFEDGASARLLLGPDWGEERRDREEISLVIKGLGEYEPYPGQPNLLWILSHPDTVRAEDCNKYDHVFVASRAFAAKLAARVKSPVSWLPQASDSKLFPEPASSAARSSVALFVGNSRGVRRPIVDWALDAKVPLELHGTGWETLLDANLVKSEFVPADRLAEYYSAVKVVLNDHWADMRREGFVSNRVFDAVFSGASVLSDDAGFPSELRAPVAVVKDAESLARAFANPPAPLTGEPLREFRRLHSFGARARAILECAEKLLAVDKERK